jgi:hypothetical protein
MKGEYRVKKCKLLICLISCIILFACSSPESDGKNKTGPLIWELNDGVLTINGKGPMPNYNSNGGPWCDLKNEYPNIIAIIINDGVINIGDNAFVGIDTVVYVSIPDSVTTISGYAFMGCRSITSIIIPDSVLNIGNYAFQGCSSLIAIDIPDSVLNIGNNAFMNCHDLLNVTLGKNVVFIGSDAFQNCNKILIVTSNNPIPPYLEIEERRKYVTPGLEGITIPRRLETGDIISGDTVRINTDSDLYRSYYSVSAFDSVSEKCRLVIPDEYIAAYKKDAEWNKFYIGRPVRVRMTPKDLSQYYEKLEEEAMRKRNEQK